MTRAQLRRLSGVVAGSRAAAAPGAGIFHLGLGNFHRAHQSVYTSAAVAKRGGEWGIIGAASRSATVVSALRAQEMLYTVVEVSPEGSRFSIPAIHTDVFVASRDPGRVVSTIADPAIRIVSLTVTENGYTYSPSTSSLDFRDPLVLHDLSHRDQPASVIGQIVAGLRRRMASTGTPLTVMSCDNLAANGHHTKRLVLEFAAALPSAEREDLIPWIEANVSFPSSMVDRIVPSTTDAYRQMVADACGYLDSIPVPAEPFTMWVVEDRFAAGRPAWETSGVTFSGEVAEYEQLKVRLLNGTHSLIAYLGALDACPTIPDALGHAYIENAARRVLKDEYLPTVRVPSTVDAGDYEEQLFTRWRNTALGHRTSQVGSDGSVKLAQRIPEPALTHLEAGRMPHHLALTFAAYLCCVAPLPGFEPGPHAAAMEDQARERLSRFAQAASGGRDLARGALVDLHLLGDKLGQSTEFADRVGDLIDVIVKYGPRAAAADVAASHTTDDLKRSA